MPLRPTLSFVLSILLLGTSAWGQHRGFGGRAFSSHTFGGRSFGGRGFQGRSMFVGRGALRPAPRTMHPFVSRQPFLSAPRNHGFTSQHFGTFPVSSGFHHFHNHVFGFSPFFDPFFFDPFFFDPFFFDPFFLRHQHVFAGSLLFDPFFFNFRRFHHHRGFGFQPFFAQSFGWPGLGSAYGTASYPCDTRFSSSLYNCLPLYPNGPPSYDSRGYERDNRSSPSETEDSSDYEPSRAPNPRSDALTDPSAAEPDAGRPGGASSPSRYRAQPVVLTYDGHTQPAASAGSPLVITSGQHHLLIVSGKSE